MIPYAIASLFRFYEILVLIWCVLSWFPMGNEFVEDFKIALDKIICPYMNLFRRFIPAMGGIDFSPIIGIIVLNFIKRLILSIL